MSNVEEEVPAVCEKCLGANPYLKMTKEPQGAQCRLCTRTFTVFKWNANRGSKFSKTIICLTCARQRNCCQSCMLDLTYGVPIHLRDAAFKMAGVDNAHDVVYSSNEVTRRYNAQKADQKFLEENAQKLAQLLLTGGEGEEDAAASQRSEARRTAEEILEKLSQNQRGTRYNAKNPVAKGGRESGASGANYSYDGLKNVDITRILSKLPFNGNLTVPKDESITSFFIFGINDEITNTMVTDCIEQKLGSHQQQQGKQFKKIAFKSVVLNHKAKCGFVSFDKRKTAEEFSEAIDKPRGFKGPGLLIVRNAPVRVTWSKVKSLGTSNLEQAKLGTIVRKQVKLLAEKDKKFKSGGSNGGGGDGHGAVDGKKKNTFKPVAPGTKTNYSTLKRDFEA